MNYIYARFGNDLTSLAKRYKDIYRDNQPYPNIAFEDFFDPKCWQPY